MSHDPDEIFDRHLQIAATNGRYGHEYHILALAIIVQDIYTYSRFALQLQHMFRSKRNGLGSHIMYRVPSHLRTDYSADNPCCIFYDMAQVHYTAILPINTQVPKFAPYTNLFSKRSIIQGFITTCLATSFFACITTLYNTISTLVCILQ